LVIAMLDMVVDWLVPCLICYDMFGMLWYVRYGPNWLIDVALIDWLAYGMIVNRCMLCNGW